MSTWINDLKNNLVFANDANSLAAASRTATASGGAVDLVDAEGNCFAILNVGTVTGTSPTLDVKIQECATSGGTYTDITGATFTQITASSKSLIINFKRAQRFVRAFATIAGTTPVFPFAVLIASMKKQT